jgi:hypothetical protein
MNDAIHSFIAVEVNWKVIQLGVHVVITKIGKEFLDVDIAMLMGKGQDFVNINISD